ncbi:DUF2169 family type VI secretion system accessory protein [Sorangium sp. So ce131]|uniref:DUF2169 family type VI secretion system accessory protein n=1 Tax=Sorangium sp. So ce131 TaxID=3133282 RepID=UPI003F5DD60E
MTRVVRPVRLSLNQRVVTVRRAHHLSVGVLLYFPLDAPELALPEAAMWQEVARTLGKDAIFDEGLPKPRGEVLVFGRAYAPGGKPQPAFPARLEVRRGDAALVDKSLYVVGKRRWQLGGPTEPEPITEMELVWENAFGGPDYPPNPRGMGLAPTEEGGARVHLLPHLEHPQHLVKSPGDRPPPACFGALDPTLAGRLAKMGTYGPKWVEQEFPGFAKDLDPEYFQVAPEDQRLPAGYFEGGEALLLENLHPTKPRLAARVPRVRARCFVQRKGAAAAGGDGNGDAPLEEVATRLETVILLPGAERGVAIFRGMIDVAEDDAADLDVLLLALDRSDAPRPLEHYRAVLAQRLDKDKGHLHALRDRDLLPQADPGAPPVSFPDERLSDMEELLKRKGHMERRSRARAQRELADARAATAALGNDPDETLPREVPPAPEPPGIEELADFVERAEADAAAAMKDAEAQDPSEQARKLCAEQGVDFDAMAEKGRREGGGPPKFRADEELARLRELAEVGRAGGAPMDDLEAKLADPTFAEGLRQTEASLLGAYRLSAHLLPPASPRDEAAQAALRADVERALAAGEPLARRDLTGADLRGLRLAGIDLGEALLEGADLTACDLSGADLSGAVLARARLERATLSGARLVEANLGEAELAGASFEGARLSRANLHRARLAGALLSGADLEGADLYETSLAGADLRGVAADDVLFFRVDLAGVRFAGAKLRKATFFQCTGRDIDFSDAELEQATFVQMHVEGASFQRARAANIRLVPESSLPGADFSGAELAGAHLRGVGLAGAIFEGAAAEEADFSEADLRGARLASLRGKGARFIRADLTDADLSGANLMDALLQKAKLAGANLARTNLFSANLLQARGDDRTSFADAHTKRVLFTRQDG